MNTLKNKFDVIILSLVVDDVSFFTTKCCVDSYIATADDLINNIFVVETNSNFNRDYKQPKVTVIKPNEEFNYNKFYNLALEKCRAEFVIGPNYDIIIKPECLQNILLEFNSNPNIHSISPIDRKHFRHTAEYFPNENKLYYGYEVSQHFMGCMFACRRSVFKTVGYLDERFYFFYQDNDLSQTLEVCKLNHGILTNAHFTHKSSSSNVHAQMKYKYTEGNMKFQREIFYNKWKQTEPFASGGYKCFKTYDVEV